MRIVLDTRYRTRSGAASYIDHIVPGLLKAESRHEFIVLRSDGPDAPGPFEAETITMRQRWAARQAVEDQVTLPRMLRRLGADIYHPMKHLGTMYPPCPQVTTAHSITLPFRGEFPISRAEEIYWKLMGTRMLRRSTALIAVSEFVRDFLIEKIGIDPRRIDVIHHGVDSRFHRLPGRPSITGPDAYLLTVGNIFPVKNFVVAAQIFARLAHQWPRLRLKMAGSVAHPYFRRVKEEVDRAGLSGRVDFLGFTPPAELVRLYNGASVLLMPSLTEGCPVTLLEAMACGVPAIGSGRGGIPEIGKDAIVVIEDPHDVPAWLEATRALLSDAARRDRLTQAALARARDFSWTRSVGLTLSAYAKVG